MTNTKWQYRLNALFILVLGSVLCSAFGYQIVTGEAPCPLCLLQRLGMTGIATGCMMNLRFGINMSHYGLALISACFGGFTSLRQISLHVCPQFPTFGSPVLGLDLYAWALVVFGSSILAIALLLYLHGINKDHKQNTPRSSTLNSVSYVFLTLIIFTEVITTYNLCGTTACQG